MKKYIEPIVELLNYATEDVVMASMPSYNINNSVNFKPGWLD